jgi:hypothetical protein|tara:strand:+ start:693 stop:815 length:123 start_codon:yes stop_codon:yes gene_type:complete
MRSTITVTDFIILLDTTIPFKGFTIALVARACAQPKRLSF